LYIYSAQEYGGCPIQNPAMLFYVQHAGLRVFGVNRHFKEKWKNQLKEKQLVNCAGD